ncbi:hypothetical protein MRB53_027926 [Persea americana]|uniref:Uncharacterized protein n=1 Tax=Persea americana TaxID=3435 RepID=A0ACC2KEJ9_PERAE|nr:hypothetical protein MRB53_027926 [Persea americana]|eukprot:TRINITY_DN15466_c0_g1_i2.p1 TRINITY_DN15466_c0_g1~~TRINITY_DN15466_c0_g1_i2.p1  ORF type:complete len:206 (+),score=21.22 TRINITY_DN15466_c0_g1_i2:1-618(+)
MKSNQIPLKSSNRRSKETPTKTKVVAKSLNPAFSAASERNSIDSLLQSVISDGSPEKNITEEISNPSLLESSDEIDLSDFALATEIEHGSRDISELSRISGGSSGSRTENVEVQVAVDLLLQARDQVVNSVDVDRRSKKIVDDLIKSVIDPSDLVAMERERFYCRLREKVYIGLLSFFVCVASVSVVVLRDSMTGMQFPDTNRPT